MVEAQLPPTVFRGDAVHTTEFGEIELLTDKIFVVEPLSDGGKIVEVVAGNLEAIGPLQHCSNICYPSQGEGHFGKHLNGPIDV
jgi:hypothetical protein